MSKDYCLETPGVVTIPPFEIEVRDSEDREWRRGYFVGYKIPNDTLYPYVIFTEGDGCEPFAYARHIPEVKKVPWELQDYIDAVKRGCLFHIADYAVFNPTVRTFPSGEIGFVGMGKHTSDDGYTEKNETTLRPFLKNI